jgi:hypothetical protein
MFTTTSRLIHVFNDKDVRMLIVVDFMLYTSSSYCYIIYWELQPNPDSDHNQRISVI